MWLYFDWSKVHVTLLVSSCSYFKQGEFFFGVAISNKHKKKANNSISTTGRANRDCWVWGHMHVLQCNSFSVHVNGLI